MKLNHLFAAALVIATGVAPIAVATPAAAQRTVVHERTVVHHDARPGDRHRTVTRRVCTNRHYGGRNHRVCRVVRHRR